MYRNRICIHFCWVKNIEKAERMSARPEDCFIFEDSANGIIAGHAARMKCIGVPDMFEFDKETKKLMFAELKTLDAAIELLKPYIN